MCKEDLLLYVKNLLQQELGIDSENRKITSSDAEEIAEKIGKRLSSRIYENLMSLEKDSKKK